MSLLLDTNVLSELVRRRPSPQVRARFAAERDDHVLCTSAICVMELRFGVARHPDGRRLWSRLERDVLADMLILPITAIAAVIAGDVRARLQRLGTPIGNEDVLIAATALEHGLTVATRNENHFSRVAGLAVVNWWA